MGRPRAARRRPSDNRGVLWRARVSRATGRPRAARRRPSIAVTDGLAPPRPRRAPTGPRDRSDRRGQSRARLWPWRSRRASPRRRSSRRRARARRVERFLGRGRQAEKSGRIGDHVLRRRGFVVGDVPDPPFEAACEDQPGDFGDVVDMGAVDDMVGFDDPPRFAAPDLVEGVAPGPVDARQAEDVGGDPPSPRRLRPAGFVSETGEPAFRTGQRRRSLVDPSAAVLAVDADGREIDDARKVGRGGDRGGEEVERPLPPARRNGDDNRLGPLQRRREPEIDPRPLEDVSLDAGGAQRGDALVRPRRPARLERRRPPDQRLGRVAEAEKEYVESHCALMTEDAGRMKPRRPGSGRRSEFPAILRLNEKPRETP